MRYVFVNPVSYSQLITMKSITWEKKMHYQNLHFPRVDLTFPRVHDLPSSMNDMRVPIQSIQDDSATHPNPTSAFVASVRSSLSHHSARNQSTGSHGGKPTWVNRALKKTPPEMGQPFNVHGARCPICPRFLLHGIFR